MIEYDEYDEDFGKIEEPRDSRGRLEGDQLLNVKFYKKAVRNAEKTEAAGVPQHDPHDFILCFSTEDQTVRIDTYAREEHKTRFPKDWARYEAKNGPDLGGTPLEHWKSIGISQVANFKAMGIFTVEALAGISDTLAGKQMGGLDAKRGAIEWLKATQEKAIAEGKAETASRIAALETEKNQMAAETAEMKKQLASLMSAMKAQEKITK